MRKLLAAAFMMFAMTGSAHAIDINGELDATGYTHTASVGFDKAAPEHNFGAPTNKSAFTAYEIYLSADANYLYGFIAGENPAAPQFANLYFGVNNGGSTIGFEIFNNKAFKPGPAATYDAPGILHAVKTTAGGVGLEFAIPMEYFLTDAFGFGFNPAHAGDKIRLNLAQALGYSVAGGQAYYGDERLGVVGVSAVPEPATWAMLIVGFGLAGSMVRARRRQGALA